MAWSERLRETLETEEGRTRFVQQFPTYLLVQFVVQKCFKDFLAWRMR